MDKLEGFKVYLEVAEKDDLALRHPPDLTPELFEKYLPFAIALGVEQKWAEKFSQVFARLEATGEGAYSPRWYQGSFSSSRMGSFASSVGSSFSSAISSASTAPGSSSGSGGGSSGEDGERGVSHEFRLQWSHSVPLVDEQLRGIILFGLLLDIKMPTASGVCANPRQVLPVAVVARHVVVQQVLFEERGAVPPLDAKFVNQAAGGNLTAAVTHPTGLNQLMHQGIYQRKVGVPLAPAGKVARLKGAAAQFARLAAKAKQVDVIVQRAPVEKFSPQ